MSITLRQYRPTDFKLVSDFLIANHRHGNRDGNWLQPAWEYMHSHPSLDESSLGRVGIWEDAGNIVGVAHYESRLGDAFLQVHPDYIHLKPVMLEYAESHFCGETEDGGKYVNVYVNDFDQEFESLVKSRGYKLVEQYNRPMLEFTIPQPFPKIDLPGGFRLKSLADENNLSKINRVLW